MLDFLSCPVFQIAMPKTDSLLGGLTPTRISPRKVRRARRVASGSNNGGDAETRKDIEVSEGGEETESDKEGTGSGDDESTGLNRLVSNVESPTVAST